MPTINQLSSVDEIGASDLLPLYSAANGDARKASMSVFADFIQTLLSSAGSITQYAAPNATGFSVLIAPPTDGASMWLVLTPAAGYAAGTIVLPPVASCKDQQELVVNSTQSVTTLTVSGNGATVSGAPTTLAANAFFRLRFEGVLKVWYRVG